LTAVILTLRIIRDRPGIAGLFQALNILFLSIMERGS